MKLAGTTSLCRTFFRTALVLGGILMAGNLSAGMASAQWSVSNSGNDNWDGRHGYAKKTIQAAIDAASDGGTVYITPGTYRGPGNVNLTFRGKNLTLVGANQSAVVDTSSVTIDGGKIDPTTHRNNPFYQLMQFSNGESSNSVIKGIRFINGGGRWMSRVRGLIQCPGGAIGIVRGNPQIINCAFVNCKLTEDQSAVATQDGGAIAIGYWHPENLQFYPCPNPIISDSTFNNCNGVRGGAIAIGGNPAAIINSTFTNNVASSSGGAVSVIGNSNVNINTNVYIKESRFTYNYGNLGGALYIKKNASGSVVGCSFLSNATDLYGYGGAIYLDYGRLWMSYTDLIANRAYRGGALYAQIDSSTPNDMVCGMYKCNFVSNLGEIDGALSAEMWGSNPYPLQMSWTIFWDNNRLTGSYAQKVRTPQQISLINSPGHAIFLNYCDVQGGYAGVGEGNINADPQFNRMPNPGPDGIWGNAVTSGAAGDDFGDLFVSPTSPCRNTYWNVVMGTWW